METPIVQVQGLYESEIRRVPMYKDLIPDYPRWFLPCGKLWLASYLNEGIVFVDNAWEDDKNTFHVSICSSLIYLVTCMWYYILGDSWWSLNIVLTYMYNTIPDALTSTVLYNHLHVPTCRRHKCNVILFSLSVCSSRETEVHFVMLPDVLLPSPRAGVCSGAGSGGQGRAHHVPRGVR